MPIQTFTEDRIEFSFDTALWNVVKWDDSTEYRGGIHSLNGQLTDPQTGDKIPQGTKAVDFVALHRDDLYLFEVKDFRGHGPENAERQEHELPLEIGLKVRDTIAGLLGAHRIQPSPWLLRANEALRERARRLHVIAWIAEDRPRGKNARKVHNKTTMIRSNQLLQRLAWCTRVAWADDPLDPFTVLAGVRARTVRTP